MSDWAALFHSLTVDTLDSVDTLQNTAKTGTKPQPCCVDTLLTLCGHSAECQQSVKVAKDAKEAENSPHLQSVNTVKSVNGGKVEEEAAVSPLVAALAALERRRPDYVEPVPWQQAVEDGRRFLARWGEQAERLGWGGADIFGLPPVPPEPHPSWQRLARVDQLGLVWLNRGRPVTAITAESATIATPRGGSLAFYRVPSTQGSPAG